jgi:hypothetical protein
MLLGISTPGMEKRGDLVVFAGKGKSQSRTTVSARPIERAEGGLAAAASVPPRYCISAARPPNPGLSPLAGGCGQSFEETWEKHLMRIRFEC